MAACAVRRHLHREQPLLVLRLQVDPRLRLAASVAALHAVAQILRVSDVVAVAAATLGDACTERLERLLRVELEIRELPG
jgi:hypothetical protein